MNVKTSIDRMAQTFSRLVQRRPFTARSSSDNRLLVFVHVPKAAGTSFNGVLRRVYGADFLEYHRNFAKFPLEGLSQQQASRLRALSAHMAYGYHRKFGDPEVRAHRPDGMFEGRDIRYVTILRDPVDRLHSYYLYVTSNPKHHLHAETTGLNCHDFFEHMRRIDNRACGNFQCALVSGTRADSDAAIAAIEANYEAAVTLENVAGLIAHLDQELGWSYGKPVAPTVNRSSGTKSSADRACITAFASEHCAHDQALYDYVKENVSPRFQPPKGIVEPAS